MTSLYVLLLATAGVVLTRATSCKNGQQHGMSCVGSDHVDFNDIPNLSLLQQELALRSARVEAPSAAHGDVAHEPFEVMDKVSNLLLEDAVELQHQLQQQNTDVGFLQRASSDVPSDKVVDASEDGLADHPYGFAPDAQLTQTATKQATHRALVQRLISKLESFQATTATPTEKPEEPKSMLNFFGHVPQVAGLVIWGCISAVVLCIILSLCWGLVASVFFGSGSGENMDLLGYKGDAESEKEIPEDGLHEVWVRSKK